MNDVDLWKFTLPVIIPFLIFAIARITVLGQVLVERRREELKYLIQSYNNPTKKASPNSEDYLKLVKELKQQGQYIVYEMMFWSMTLCGMMLIWTWVLLR
jgi:hypothetical protein